MGWLVGWKGGEKETENKISCGPNEKSKVACLRSLCFILSFRCFAFTLV